MKRLILFVLISTAFIKISAQQPKIGIDPENKFKDHKLFFQKDSLNRLSLDKLEKTRIHSPFSAPQAQFSHISSNGDRVYLLAQDNMPCLVPDLSKYNYNMPVAKGMITGKIPNGSPVIPLIPKQH